MIISSTVGLHPIEQIILMPTPKPTPLFQHTMYTHTQNPSLDFFGKFVEDAKKKEMTGEEAI